MSEKREQEAEKVPNWEKKTENPKKKIGTKLWHKNPPPKKNYFCSAEMAPQEMVQF